MMRYRRLKKSALEVVKAQGILPRVSHAISATLGRLTSLPTSLAIGQEKVHEMLRDPDEEKVNELASQLKDDPHLKDVVIRLAHTDPIDNLARTWANKKNTILDKLIGTQVALPNALSSTISRGDHYDPFANSISLYSNIPEVWHHELGHAKEINSHEGILNAIRKPAMIAGGMLDQRLGIQSGPITQWTESMANSNAEKTYKGDPREFRRRLWPARSTYITAMLTSIAMLHPKARAKILDMLGKRPGEGKIKSMLRGSIPMFAAGAAGRLAAETRNLFDSGKRKEDESR